METVAIIMLLGIALFFTSMYFEEKKQSNEKDEIISELTKKLRKQRIRISELTKGKEEQSNVVDN